MGEAAKVGGLYLTAAQGGDVDAVSAGHGLGAGVGRGTDVPGAGASGIDHYVQFQAAGLFAERGLG
ncbi:hypothetical protein D3C80_1725260 [compost metagenome]